MNNHAMIARMKEIGISFEPGLTEVEFEKIEVFFGFRFPAEIREFLACGVPAQEGFFNWRDCSEENLEKLRAFYREIEESFIYDIENNCDDLVELLGEDFAAMQSPEKTADAILDYYRQSVKLVPFYHHRCFFDGRDGLPIVSFWQPTDTILYGPDFEDYLENEFFKGNRWGSYLELKEKIRDTGIWYQLIE